MNITAADIVSGREHSLHGNISWREDDDPTALLRNISWRAQHDDPLNVEALYERRELDVSSSNRPPFGFRVALTSETVHLTKEISASSTAPDFLTVFPTLIFMQICSAAEEEVFEHGMESVFSLSLASFIEEYKEQAVKVASRFLASGSVDKVVAMETLHQMGLSEHERTYDERLDLLWKIYTATWQWCAMVAMYGLSSMDDPKTIQDIELAYEQEKDPRSSKVYERCVGAVARYRNRDLMPGGVCPALSQVGQMRT